MCEDVAANPVSELNSWKENNWRKLLYVVLWSPFCANPACRSMFCAQNDILNVPIINSIFHAVYFLTYGTAHAAFPSGGNG